MSKVSYFLNSLLRRFSKPYCPSCGCSDAHLLDRKVYGLTVLLQCKTCFLRYRFPVDGKDFNYKFYQTTYVQRGLTTDLPDSPRLESLVKTNFLESEKDFSIYFGILQKISYFLGKNINILDYGANWGYTCFQFERFSFVDKCIGFELSQPRRHYGENNLGIRYIDNPLHEQDQIDVLFSSHAIEHMSNPSELKKAADILLRQGGFVLITCPNGSDSARLANNHWSKSWGELHPNYISDQFLCSLFSDYAGVVASEEILKCAEINLDFHEMTSKLPTTPNLLLLATKPLKGLK